MLENIYYTCPPNITSFSQCKFPNTVSYVFCENNQIKSFQYLPNTVTHIYCDNNQIKSFKYLPGTVTHIYCDNNQIKSFQYLPGSVRKINCRNNQIKSFRYLPGSVRKIYCNNNPCRIELILKGLAQIHQENEDIIVQQISNFQIGISKLRYMRLNYLIYNLWKMYWYDQKDAQGYSRACRYLAFKNCPNGFLNMNIL